MMPPDQNSVLQRLRLLHEATAATAAALASLTAAHEAHAEAVAAQTETLGEILAELREAREGAVEVAVVALPDGGGLL